MVTKLSQIKLKGWIVILFAVLGLFGCQSGDKDLAKIKEDLDSLVGKTQEKLKTLTDDSGKVTEAATAEIEKVFKIEYKVHPLSKDATAEEIQDALSSLGEERWDCFQVIPAADGQSILCKRSPKTYLRYVPRFIP